MKPNFALILSFDGIRLLHRAPAGWLVVGDVALDVPDLGAALAGLRADAQRLDDQGMRTKLVIPDAQIRYLTIDTGSASDDEIAALVAGALDGATPYAVADLAYDWARDGDQTHIAAVARETLDEAEAFAIEHEFHPVSFVAMPETSAFSGEPFFGAAPSSAGWLAPTDSLSRDMQPIRIIGTADIPADPVDASDPAIADSTADQAEAAEETAPAAVDDTDLGPADSTAAQAIAAEDSAAPPDEAAPADGTAEQAAAARGDADDSPPPLDTAASDAPADSTAEQAEAAQQDDAPLAVPADTPAPPPAFASIRAARDVPPAPPRVSATAPVIDIDDDDALPDAPAVTGKSPAARDESQARPAPSARAAGKARGASLGAFLSRRGRAERQDPAPPKRPAPSIPPAPPLPASAAADAGPAQSMGVSPALAQPATGPDPEAERERMTIFGARKPAKPARAKPQVGGKPRYLGLMLTAALLLFLAGVAAWASIFSEDSALSRLWGGGGDSETADISVPAEAVAPIDTATVEGDEAVGEQDDATELAAVDPDILPDTAPRALPEPVQPQELTPDEAAVRYAATGIWQMAPDQPGTPGFTQLDDIYTASIDPDVNMGDAVALPPLGALQSDRMMGEQASPAAPGTEFDLDGRGLVRATPEGALTPDGVLVIAGRPPILPARLPQRADVAPELSDADQARLGAFRPRARPDDLVQQNERSNLGGLTRAELAEIRPRLRPELEKAEQEADETATEQAVALSVKPRPRPSNFAQIVDRAERRQAAQPETVQTAAAVAPRTVAPSVPSRANVAREATVRNALRLNRVNLIGVYGKPSSRRALIRLANGRYKKVQVGDRLDGGRVQAIGESELRYTKGGRSVTLTMPRG